MIRKPPLENNVPQITPVNGLAGIGAIGGLVRIVRRTNPEDRRGPGAI
jgi:hypothetical protein